ncbi:MAG: hypothetical protein R3E31_30305 [Chloroflexota bacterium]|nr:hypothetical protein [Anaerolineales bacterium]
MPDTETAQASASLIQLLGAGGFGAIVGWYVYYINRYRTGDVQFSDLVTVIGIIGGGSILAIFPAATDLFGAYGIGLFLGFFGYFAILLLMVGKSDSFHVEWFLDGRKKKPSKGYEIPESARDNVSAMSVEEEERYGGESAIG